EHPGLVLSRQQLLERVWGYAVGDERLVDVHVGRLRQKIEEDSRAPRYLVTVRGLGYKLQR
ncbi:MAG: winged helix-turn-helix domain-containing protein, partial [Dactylosporangium sp.]|nr:winged helix-turn-helix domain-containing protein [Dactylosporangium sp.]